MENSQNRVTLLKIFGVCCGVSALTVGGGYVIVGLLQKRVVEDLKWIEKEEMLDLVAVAQSSPGAIAVNIANLIGWKLRGAQGATVAILGSILPPMATIVLIGMFYMAFRDYPIVANILKGMTAGVAAVIIDVVIALLTDLLSGKKYLSIIVCFVAFVAALCLGVNVIFILLTAGILGLIYGARKGRDF